MELGTIIGIVLGSALLSMAIMTSKNGTFAMFIDIPSIFIVGGGATAAMMIAYPLSHVAKVVAVTKKTFFVSTRSVLETISLIVSLSESSRREGILSLENRLEELSDAFLTLGVRMAVDGMSPEVVESIMRTEIDAVGARHDSCRGLVANFGKYGPAFGMIGTLMGLVMMLAKLDPDTIGPGMAVAILTTLYGAVMSNLFLLPMADKLSFYNEQELLIMEITVRGVIAIQSGENPRVTKQKLMTFIPPSARPRDEEGA
ncbi:MAG: motility protein A [Thermoguttaceae bacterium]